MTPKVHSLKGIKMINRIASKLKSFALGRTLVKRMNSHVADQDKISANHTSDKGLVSSQKKEF